MAYRKLPGLFLLTTIEIHSHNISVIEFCTCVTNPCTLDHVWHGSTFDGRILENHHREQKESYETQVEGLTLKVDHLQNENSKLQNLFQEKSNVNENIRQEVSRLSSENSVRYCSFDSIIHFMGQMRSRTEHNIICAFPYLNPVQVIPELKLQISELQRQKQELEAHAEEQSRELAGWSEYFVF